MRADRVGFVARGDNINELCRAGVVQHKIERHREYEYTKRRIKQYFEIFVNERGRADDNGVDHERNYTRFDVSETLVQQLDYYVAAARAAAGFENKTYARAVQYASDDDG